MTRTRRTLALRASAFAVFAALAPVAALDAAAQEKGSKVQPLEAPTVEVIGETPLPGLGVPRDQVPHNVQAVSGGDLKRRQSLNLPEFLSESLPSVTINEIAGNPFQVDLNYRGFAASPLLGTPQGLSVYLDGMRLNEPFGEIVYWDLVPRNAISAINLLPGSNPVFGLNTLGGALSLRTKSGETDPGMQAEAGAGSFGRYQGEAEVGGSNGPLAWYLAANGLREDGWRDFSPSRLGQVFAKFGHQTRDSDVDLSVMAADNRLTGNALTPESLLRQRRETVYTYPDSNENRGLALNLTGGYAVGDALLLGGNLFHRDTRVRQTNPDVNQIVDTRSGVAPFEDGPNDLAAGGSGLNVNSASLNRSNLSQRATGFNLQGTWHDQHDNQLTVGSAVEFGDATFRRSYQLASFADDRSAIPTGAETEIVNLSGRTRTRSLFAAYNWRFLPNATLSASGRYNHTRVDTTDRLSPALPPPARSLDNDFRYTKFNPALGVTFEATPAITLYASYGQGNRAPSPIELACADRDNPCLLPNAMQSDPFLKQVVTRTVEAGVRGRFAADVSWELALFRARNSDDILFISAGNSLGFFDNFGRTRRQGLEASLAGSAGSLDWSLNYSLIDATFESPAVIVSPNNSSRGTVAGLQDDEIQVVAGDRLPGVARHQIKLFGKWRATPDLRLGASVVAASWQYARGNENNRHRAGTATDLAGATRDFEGSGRVPGYAIVNLTGAYRLGKNWELFGRASNIFDKRYATSGQLAENAFPDGLFVADTDAWRRENFVAPGAPRAFWVGLRFTDKP